MTKTIAGNKKVYKVRIYDMGVAQHKFDVDRKGSNEPSMEEVKSSLVIGLDDDLLCDITMCIGQFLDAKEYVLLNMRFHRKIYCAEQFGEEFFDFAQKNINVGKGFNEVSIQSLYIICTILSNEF